MQTTECLKKDLDHFYCRACHKDSNDSHPLTIDVPCNVRSFKGESFKLWRCANCQSINTLGSVDLNKYYKDYPLNYVVLDLSYRLAYNKRIRLFKKFGLKKDSRILDYGCGGGAFVDWLKHCGYKKSFGYDKFSKDFANEDVLEKKYDFLVSYDVVEHMDEPEGLFQRAKKLLNPSGVLILGTPDADNLDLRNPQQYSLELHPPYHRVIFSTQALKNMASCYGFNFIHKDPGFYMDLPLPFLNYRFIREYVKKTGGFVDVAVEDPQLDIVFKSPKLLLQGLFGFMAPTVNTNMTMVFQLPGT